MGVICALFRHRWVESYRKNHPSVFDGWSQMSGEYDDVYEECSRCHDRRQRYEVPPLMDVGSRWLRGEDTDPTEEPPTELTIEPASAPTDREQ